MEEPRGKRAEERGGRKRRSCKKRARDEDLGSLKRTGGRGKGEEGSRRPDFFLCHDRT